MFVFATLALVAGSALFPLTSEDEATPAAGKATDGTWTQWRGPARDGSVGAKWPADLAGLTPLWSVEDLGPSYAGPIVSETHVFTVETRDEAFEIVRAFDRTTGEAAWTAEWEGAMEVPFFAARNGSWVRATPAFDGETLYVAGMRDVLAAIDASSGEILWVVDFVERYGTGLPSFGFVSSPLVVGDHVVVQAAASLVKLDKRTGEEVWRGLTAEAGWDGRGSSNGMNSPFSSPVLAELEGKEQLVVLSRTNLSGVDLEDGSLLWTREIEAFRGMNILTPMVVDDAIFTAPYGGRAQLLVPLEGEVDPVWDNRAQGNMTSPVVVDGHAYLFTRANRFHCIDLATGEDAWISEPPGDDYQSLVTNGERILALSNTGVLRLIDGEPKAYTVLDERDVADEESWAHLAVAGEHVVVRSQTGMSTFRWTPAAKTPPAGAGSAE